MATIKSYTDISQSKKLAEILPLESADMYYEDDISVEFGHGWHTQHIPCWSFSALLGILTEIKICHYNNRYYCQYMNEGDEFPIYSTTEYDNPIDACVEMILKLHELAESKNLRIKSDIQYAVRCAYGDNSSKTEKIITWLEKQGEQQKPDKVEPKFKVGDTIYYNSFGELKSMIVANVFTDSTDNPMYEDKEGNAVFEKDIIEYKSAEVRTTGYCNVQDIEQKPAEWSEEDEKVTKWVIDYIGNCPNESFDFYGGVGKEAVLSWLNKLKDIYCNLRQNKNGYITQAEREKARKKNRKKK